jgi:uncharacterized protein (DUF1015 family)
LADIRPFHGVHYNLLQVKDLAKVLCPPYDIITPQIQQELYQRNDCNFVRIEFGRELPSDKSNDNRYTRAAAALEKWIQQGVMEVDAESSFYVADHLFTHQGIGFRRRSICCLVKLEEWDRMIVRPHEGTLSRPKSDRLQLLWALRADTSPIMALYEDGEGTVSSLLEEQTSGKPLLAADIGGGESHRLWAVSDSSVIERIRKCLEEQPLYIADGHHRYESALTYRRERRATSSVGAEEEPYDFVMMALVNFEDPGLVILPAHRLVRGLPASALDGLMAGLKTCFTVEEIPLDKVDTVSQINGLLPEKEDEVKLVLYGLGRERLVLLTLRDFSKISPMIPYFHSDIYQKLDVSIVDHVILEEILGLTHDKIGAFLDYTDDTREAVKRVAEQEYQLAVIVNPVKPSVIKAIADSGDRMPRKSTYFYPKTPAGLVCYRFG